MKLITSISGIRGIYGKTLTDSIASDYIKSFSNIQSNGKILLAQDSRPHGKKIYKAACEVLTSLGRDVISCGIIPTPTAQFIIKEQIIPYIESILSAVSVISNYIDISKVNKDIFYNFSLPSGRGDRYTIKIKN